MSAFVDVAFCFQLYVPYTSPKPAPLDHWKTTKAVSTLSKNIKTTGVDRSDLWEGSRITIIDYKFTIMIL